MSPELDTYAITKKVKEVLTDNNLGGSEFTTWDKKLPKTPLKDTIATIHLCVFVLHRPASFWGDHPGPDTGLGVRPALQTQTMAQAQSERQGALRPHAAVAQRSSQCRQAEGHEKDGEERWEPESTL